MGSQVFVAISGGVDSSVCLHLAKKRYGSSARAVHLRMGEASSDAARQVASELASPYLELDFRQEFKLRVIDYFVNSYRLGETPNPCSVCNRSVKIGLLCEYLEREYGRDFRLVTGHYAKISEQGGRFTISKAEDQSKDQSYFLSGLSQEMLSHLELYLGDYTKSEVREIALSIGLDNYDSKDSMDICFTRGLDYREFLSQYGISEAPGNFVDTSGKVLGRHLGISHYTVGQRKGLGIAASEPLFVREIKPQTNEIILGRACEMRFSEFLVNDMNWVSIAPIKEPIEAIVKLRSQHSGTKCAIVPRGDDGIKVQLIEPVQSISKGQFAVFYSGIEPDLMLGGGPVTNTLL